MPLMLGGLRNATLQIVATATVAAYASLGGLGRYLIDGIKEREFQLALVGALAVAALALILDGLLAFACGCLCRAPPTAQVGRSVRAGGRSYRQRLLASSASREPDYGRRVNEAPLIRLGKAGRRC